MRPERETVNSPDFSVENARDPKHPLRFLTSDGELYDVDWRDIDEAMRRNPDGRTVPHNDPNILLLTADDCAWLWMRILSTARRNK